MRNVLKPSARSVLIPSGLTAAASKTDAAIPKKIFGSGNTTLETSNEKMNDISKIVQPLEESRLLMKGVTETIKIKQKNKKENFWNVISHFRC